jgi:hypothetical protein
MFALGGSGAARVHEHFNLFFFIRVRITCYIRRARYCKPSFLTKRYRRPEMFMLNWNLMHNAFDPFAFGFYGGVANFTSRGKHAWRVCAFLLYLVIRRRARVLSRSLFYLNLSTFPFYFANIPIFQFSFSFSQKKETTRQFSERVIHPTSFDIHRFVFHLIRRISAK